MEAVYVLTHLIMGICIVSIVVVVLMSKDSDFNDAEIGVVLTRLPRVRKHPLNTVYLSRLIAIVTSLLIH